jgi:hypothetical protein
MIAQNRPDQMSPIQLEMLAREFDGDVSLFQSAEGYKGLIISSPISLLSCLLLYHNNNPVLATRHPRLPCSLRALEHRISSHTTPNTNSPHHNRVHLLKHYKSNKGISRNNWLYCNINSVNYKLRRKLLLLLVIRRTSTVRIQVADPLDLSLPLEWGRIVRILRPLTFHP